MNFIPYVKQVLNLDWVRSINDSQFFSEYVLKTFSTLTQMPYHGVTGSQTGILCQFTRAAVTQYHRPRGLNHRTLPAPGLEARGQGHGVSRAVLLRMLSWLPLFYRQPSVFPGLWTHPWSQGILACVCLCSISPFRKVTSYTGSGPTLTISSLLIASARNLYPNSITWLGAVLFFTKREQMTWAAQSWTLAVSVHRGKHYT